MTAEILELEHPFTADLTRLLHVPVYTHVTWRTKPGRSEEFIATWNRLADLFARLECPPIELTLIRRVDEPAVFHSIGRWQSLSDAQDVSESLEAIDALADITELCEEGMPAVYEVIRRELRE